MNGKRSTVIPALLAIAIAVGVIGFGMYAGIPINLTKTSTSSQVLTTQGQTPTQSQTQSQSSQTASQSSPTNQQTTSSSQSSPSGGQEGTLSILLTDPPNVPQGVTKVYVTYRDLEVHVSQAGNQSGWTQVQAQGQIELLGTLNVSRTLSSAKVATGVYNQLRFNISSAMITYDSQNYTAFVQSAELIVPIVHGVPVNATGPTAAIIDISPTVVNIGSSATPEFIIRSVAVAYPVPSGDVTTNMQEPGGDVSLMNASWWLSIVQHAKTDLAISNATLTSTSLDLNVGNTGSNSTQLTLVIISPLVTPVAAGYLPGSFFGNAVFAIMPNGTLTPLLTAVPLAATAGSSVQATVSPIVFRNAGYNLTAGATVDLSYSGPIHLGFLAPDALQGAIVPGHMYLVTVLGTQTTVSTVVVAS